MNKKSMFGTFCLPKASGHTFYIHSTTSGTSLLINICGVSRQIKSNMAGVNQQQSNRNELVNLVRECVRSEIELQRSGCEGNANLLARTRDLVASSARSASRDVANWLSPLATIGSTQSVFSK